jgi:hypothetical protein
VASVSFSSTEVKEVSSISQREGSLLKVSSITRDSIPKSEEGVAFTRGCVERNAHARTFLSIWKETILSNPVGNDEESKGRYKDDVSRIQKSPLVLTRVPPAGELEASPVSVAARYVP